MADIIEFPKSQKYLIAVIIDDLKDRLIHLESFAPEDGCYKNEDTFRSGWENAYWEQGCWLNNMIEELEKNL
jgi:hypothetical protein